MRWFHVALLATAVTGVSYAEIRQYDPSTGQNTAGPVAAPAEQPQIEETAPPSPTFTAADPEAKRVDAIWNQVTSQFSSPTGGGPVLLVFLNTADFTPVLAKTVLGLKDSPDLQALHLPPRIYINKLPRAVDYAKTFAKGVEFLGDDDEISVDDEDDLAQSFGVPTGQSTLVYRDSAGAVRLYNLPLELDKFQRQLARDRGAAQSAR